MQMKITMTWLFLISQLTEITLNYLAQLLQVWWGRHAPKVLRGIKWQIPSGRICQYRSKTSHLRFLTL
jgi:hypothetical protein